MKAGPGGPQRNPQAGPGVFAGTRHLIILPVVLMLYVATVYGRFHSVADSIAGILAALVVVRVSPGAGRVVKLVRGMRFSPPVGRQPAVEVVRDMLPPEERT